MPTYLLKMESPIENINCNEISEGLNDDVIKSLDGCNYNKNETPVPLGNQDIITSNDTSKGNDQEPAQSKSSIKTTTIKPRKYQDHYYNSNITQGKMQKTYYAI